MDNIDYRPAAPPAALANPLQALPAATASAASAAGRAGSSASGALAAAFTGPRERGSATKLIDSDPDQVKNYIKACVALKTKSRPGANYSIYDEYVGIHLAVIGLQTNSTFVNRWISSSFTGVVPDLSSLPPATFPSGPAAGVNGAHGGPAFTAWHREYLLRFEDELREIDPTVSIPYWDWTDHDGTLDLFTDDFLAPNGSAANSGAVLTGALKEADFPIREELHFSRFREAFPIANWGKALRRSIPTLSTGELDVCRLASDIEIGNLLRIRDYEQMRVELESGNRLHGGGHVWVGASMLLWASPNDPIFWMHHANVDRMWAAWQELRRAEWEAANPGGTYSYDLHYLPTTIPAGYGHNLNDPMWPWDGGDSKPAVHDPASKIGVVGTTVPETVQRDLNAFAFAPQAQPHDMNLPTITDRRTPADVLDTAAIGVTYDQLE